MECLVQIDAWDPVAGAAVSLYASSADDDRICHLNAVTWWPSIARLPVLRQDWFDGTFGRAIEAPSSDMAMAIEAWADFARYAFTDARFRLWTGNAGDVWASWTLRFDGRVTAQPAIAEGIATVRFAVDDRYLDGSLLTPYAGTGGAEGDASQKGVAKPLSLGAPRYASGVLIDAANTVVQLSNGAIQGVEVAFDKLSAFSASIGDYASYAALVAAKLAGTIPAGRWATALAAGMVCHGAPLDGKPSYHVQGDNGGTDGWARLPGELARRLAILSGGTGKINDASLDALDVARPWPLSIYLDSQTTAREQIQRLAASVNAVAGSSWLGQLYIAAVPRPQAVAMVYGGTRPIYGGTNAIYIAVSPGVLGASQATLATDGSALPPVASVEQIEMGAPWWQLAIEAERTWNVHALSEVAFTGKLLPRGDYAGGTTYREGDIVKYTDGVDYLYINPTPTAGNAPPNGAYWSAYETAETWASITGPNKPADNATVGAPSGTPVGSITANDVASTVKSGGGVATNNVDTAAMLDGAVTGVTEVSMGSPISGSGVFVNALDFNVSLAAAGSIIVQITAAQSYSTSPPYQVDFELQIDGTTIRSVGGSGALIISIALSGSKTVASGSRNIKLRWKGAGAAVSLQSASATVLWRYK